MEPKACPICKSNLVGAQGKIEARYLYDDRYGFPGKYVAVNCTKCGHISQEASFTPQQIETLYSQFYPRSLLKLEDYHPHTERSGLGAWLDGAHSSVFRWVPEKVRVLDIGCGFGEALGYHQARGCDVYGVEADENIRRVAERFNYKVHVGVFDSVLYDPESFDYVTLDQVFEHMQSPVDTLKGIAKVLKPGGCVILSVPNAEGWGVKLFGRRWIHWHAPYHLQFYTTSSMRLAAEQSGMVLEKTFTVTNSSWLHYQWLHLVTYPLEGEPSVFWSGKGKKNVFLKVLFKLLNIVHRLKVNHVITRAFDGINIGDNRLYFLRKL